MRTVGVRELKARLSEYLRAARDGEVVLVTERGRVVAELRAPITTRDVPPDLAGLAELAERGVLTLGMPGPGSYPKSSVRATAGTARALLDEGRDE